MRKRRSAARDVRSGRRAILQEETMEDVREVDACAEAEGRLLLATAFETATAADGLAGSTLAGAELLRRVRRRTTRQRRARALVPTGAVAALGGAAALAVTLTATVASAPSAFAAVTAAAAKTSAESFHMSAQSPQATTQGTGNEIGAAWDWKVTGEFAPSHGVGEEVLLTHRGKFQILFIDKQVYLRASIPNVVVGPKPWLEGKMWPLTASQSAASPQFVARESADPGALLGLLKSAGTVTAEGPSSGPGWTGTKYGFTVTTPKDAQTATGTVYVDAQGLVRRMAATFAYPVLAGPNSTFTEDVTFSDFGAPVSVTVPPASQVLRSNRYILPTLLPARAASQGGPASSRLGEASSHRA
jgi:hypothetical protein